MTPYELVRTELQSSRQTLLFTGLASFIGSKLPEILLKLGQTVVGLDSFATCEARKRGSLGVGR